MRHALCIPQHKKQGEFQDYHLKKLIQVADVRIKKQEDR